MFEDLERKFRMFALRKKGIVPIMFYLDFQVTPVPLAFGRDVETEYEVGVYRTAAEERTGAPPRLLLDLRTVLKAHRGSGSAATLGFEKRKGPLQEVGGGQVLQVFTRPLAPAGERGVSELPEELEAFNVLPWQAPYPTVETMGEEPPDFREVEPGAWRQFTSAWGLGNTDVNQHVNVEEYIAHAEDHFSRLVLAAGLPLARHCIRRTQLVFRKPFFCGEAFGMQGRLWVKDAQTRFIGGFHNISPEGEWTQRPNVAARYDGELEEG
jgi:hypothetical protein